MQRDSAAYMFGFAGVVCFVCAVFVSTAAVELKDRQKTNQTLDRQKNVLYVTGIASPSEQLERQEILARFDKRIKAVIVDMATGDVVDNPPFDVATYDMDKAAADPQLGEPAPPNESSIQRFPKYGLVYEVVDDAGNVEMVVLPIKGYGLWSTLYGYLAVDKDGNTVRGITYYDQKETPGLGGEVENPRWKALWPGRKIYDESGKESLQVIKGQAGPASTDPYHVDGLSGATLTSRGVSHMLQLWLGPEGFKPFLEKFGQQHS
ncbi:MAG: Na(+)-translocating NADH-quinone reductase subunit C [Bryobacterales bacterium]